MLVLLLAAFALREVRLLAGTLPDLEAAALSGIGLLQEWTLSLTDHAPPGVRNLLRDNVTVLFSDGTAMLNRATPFVLSFAGNLLTHVPDSALTLGTGLISAVMISAKLPRIREALRQRVPKSWKEQYLPALQTVKASVGAYLLAQAKLASVTFAIVTGGLLILGTHLAPLWGFLIALVDAVPLLGTGTVMLPWALVCFLQDDHVRAIGILAVYAAAVTTRSVLEPRLIGRQMGLDPLVTLVALYLGFRLWGVMGMLLAPLAAATAIRLSNTGNAQAPFDEGAGTEEKGS
mgnify:CR=1 FL=1